MPLVAEVNQIKIYSEEYIAGVDHFLCDYETWTAMQ